MSYWYEVTVTTTDRYFVEMHKDDEEGAVDIVLEEHGNNWDCVSSGAVAADLESFMRQVDKDKIFPI